MAKAKTPAKNAPATETAGAPASVISLQTVIDATKADGFVYTPASFHDPLIASGDVEINVEMKDEAGNIATRATDKALNTVNTQTTPAGTAAPEKVAPKFEIEAGIPIPARTRVAGAGLRAGRTPIYPFDALEIGQSFFVPNVGEKSAAKAMASTVAGANSRYVEVIEGQTRENRKGKTVPATKQLRKFKIFDTERDVTDAAGVVTKQKGARVFRVALDAETLAA